MADNDDTHDKNNEVGYGKPPGHTRFVKGQSGNPNGRPKGSQNFFTILDKVGREPVRVTENGRVRYITKGKATVLQLMNKAVAGDLNAARVLLPCLMWLANSTQTVALSPVVQERNDQAMKSLFQRIRESKEVTPENDVNPAAKNPPEKEES
jgi:hypothetical protein